MAMIRSSPSRKRKSPKGFRYFTDYSKKDISSLKKEGYEVKKGRDPYTTRGGRVLFYRKKRR